MRRIAGFKKIKLKLVWSIHPGKYSFEQLEEWRREIQLLPSNYLKPLAKGWEWILSHTHPFPQASFECSLQLLRSSFVLLGKPKQSAPNNRKAFSFFKRCGRKKDSIGRQTESASFRQHKEHLFPKKKASHWFLSAFNSLFLKRILKWGMRRRSPLKRVPYCTVLNKHSCKVNTKANKC